MCAIEMKLLKKLYIYMCVCVCSYYQLCACMCIYIYIYNSIYWNVCVQGEYINKNFYIKNICYYLL